MHGWCGGPRTSVLRVETVRVEAARGALTIEDWD